MSATGFTRVITGRADLLCAGPGSASLEEYIAELLGYQYNPPQPPRIEPPVQEGEAVPVKDPS